MPEEAGLECAANVFDSAEPVDEMRGGIPDAGWVLGDDRRPEDE